MFLVFCLACFLGWGVIVVIFENDRIIFYLCTKLALFFLGNGFGSSLSKKVHLSTWSKKLFRVCVCNLKNVFSCRKLIDTWCQKSVTE